MSVTYANSEQTPRVFIIHENEAWVEPLQKQFEAMGIPAREWFLHQGSLDLTEQPPEGVFYNRMSASSHTRGHRYAPEFTASVLAWLKRHDRIVVNGPRALQLELSKVEQYQALAQFGIETPKTIAVIGKEDIAESARKIGFPVILKHNRAGKGLGVKLLHSEAALRDHLASDEFEPSVDGLTLVQQYIEAPRPFITRVEFVGGKFLYAVRVDTSGGFELCPAEACAVESLDEYCPTVATTDMFEILSDFDHVLIPKWEAFLQANDIGIAGIEFITDKSGRSFTYDVNTNTNYNPEAEEKDGRQGMKAIASYLGDLLEQQSKIASAA